MKRFAAIVVLTQLTIGCDAVSSDPKATPEARYALGVASPYLAEPLDADDTERLNHSIIARREKAWQIIQKVVENVSSVKNKSVDVPRWMTWYARNDFDRLFNIAYSGIGAQDRRARTPITDQQSALAEAHLADELVSFPNWNQTRIDNWLGTLDTDAKWRGVGGTARTLYSPGATKHVLQNYPKASACNQQIADGSSTDCLSKEFTSDSVIVKASWHRTGHAFDLPVYDTDAVALAARLSDGGRSWQVPDRSLTVQDSGLVMQTKSNGNYQLTGLHIMSKESKDWLWITLWWSDSPDTDFGADRPASLSAGPWGHYKMCVVSGFREEATDIADLENTFPSLAAAVKASQSNGGNSWCSNPYLEKGDDNQKTNCIGCHQHAGTDVDADATFSDSDEFPDFGREKMLSTFPADYLWSLTAEPENLGYILRSRMQHFDTVDKN